ncbi:MAG: sulfur carrier protein ThiS [Selenomonadaceae bacterium]|nr:sulfur carrier protein ThiS [Selenomonadaceae bacterium]
MVIKVNGENLNLEKSLNIAELLMAVKAAQPEYVTVQLNGEFVEREDFPKIFVKDSDEVEFLYFMGGGQHGTADQ